MNDRSSYRIITVFILALAFAGCPRVAPIPEFHAVLIDAASQKPVPSARVILAAKKEGLAECVIDTSLTGVSDSRGEVQIPKVKPGEYIVFYNISAHLAPGLQGKVVKYGSEGKVSLSSSSGDIATLIDSLGPLKGSEKLEKAEGAVVFVTEYLFAPNYDLALMTPKGELLKVRLPAAGSAPMRIEIKTDIGKK